MWRERMISTKNIYTINSTTTNTGVVQKWNKLPTNMNRNFTEGKKITWLLLMELETEEEDVNGNEMCTDETCGTSCVKCLHHINYCCVMFGVIFGSYIG